MLIDSRSISIRRIVTQTTAYDVEAEAELYRRATPIEEHDTRPREWIRDLFVGGDPAYYRVPEKTI